MLLPLKTSKRQNEKSLADCPIKQRDIPVPQND